MTAYAPGLTVVCTHLYIFVILFVTIQNGPRVQISLRRPTGTCDPRTNSRIAWSDRGQPPIGWRLEERCERRAPATCGSALPKIAMMPVIPEPIGRTKPQEYRPRRGTPTDACGQSTGQTARHQYPRAARFCRPRCREPAPRRRELRPPAGKKTSSSSLSLLFRLPRSTLVRNARSGRNSDRPRGLFDSTHCVAQRPKAAASIWHYG